MARSVPLVLSLLSSLLLMAMAGTAEKSPSNQSSSLSSLIWATGKDEADLLAMSEPAEEAYVAEGEMNELAGGFSSLDGMLQWAIGHSDPAKLKQRAQDVQKLSEDELKKRQAGIKSNLAKPLMFLCSISPSLSNLLLAKVLQYREERLTIASLKELMEKLKMPSDAELMKIAINDLKNSSITLEDLQRALNELLFLVEPIDNANDLDKLGGLYLVIRELDNSETDIRTTSAWILGKACQNNALVQNQILTYGALVKLLKMVNSSFREEAIKALYAISALIRNNEIGQKLFCKEEGILMLQDIMSNTSIDIRLRKKAVYLVGDLAEYQLLYPDNTILHLLGDRLFLKAVVDLISTADLDLQEKALLAIRSLLQLTSTDASDLRDFCSLDQVLVGMKENLDKLILDDDFKDFAHEIESLRREVLIIFHRKLEQVASVPT